MLTDWNEDEDTGSDFYELTIFGGLDETSSSSPGAPRE
jgi:hypothetical protein